jgi:hypothetical protein
MGLVIGCALSLSSYSYLSLQMPFEDMPVKLKPNQKKRPTQPTSTPKPQMIVVERESYAYQMFVLAAVTAAIMFAGLIASVFFKWREDRRAVRRERVRR